MKARWLVALAGACALAAPAAAYNPYAHEMELAVAPVVSTCARRPAFVREKDARSSAASGRLAALPSAGA